MTDQTHAINELLAKHAGAAAADASYHFDRINEFLKEAYRINARVAELLIYLRSIRQPYLSHAPPPRRRHMEHQNPRETPYLSDQQRDQIDAEAKSVLRDLNTAVSGLAQAEKIRQDAGAAIAAKRRRRNGFGLLGQWAAGGGATSKSPEEQLEDAKAEGIKAHREGVIWYLQRRLEQCGLVQSAMMQTRLEREVEKSKSVLHKTRGAGPVPVWEDKMEEPRAPTGKSKSPQAYNPSGVPLQELEINAGHLQANEEQMQLLARENRDILKQYENKLDKVRATERSLLEISELQTTLANNLEIQSIHIDQLVQDSHLTTENVGAGNKELRRASERKSTAKFVFYATISVCSFFIVWDFLI